MPIKTSDYPADLPYLAPLLGEHNAEILHELLGTAPSEIAAMVAAGVLVSGPHETRRCEPLAASSKAA